MQSSGLRKLKYFKAPARCQNPSFNTKSMLSDAAIASGYLPAGLHAKPGKYTKTGVVLLGRSYTLMWKKEICNLNIHSRRIKTINHPNTQELDLKYRLVTKKAGYRQGVPLFYNWSILPFC
jgi:hypothetical protein